jgi:hypothetical protein
MINFGPPKLGIGFKKNRVGLRSQKNLQLSADTPRSPVRQQTEPWPNHNVRLAWN